MPKILVAEDDRDIRELIVLTLEFNGFNVKSVEDGAYAVEAAQNDIYDLILMDVRMPRMTGYEACRHLRDMDSTKETPIIFLSAKGQEAEMQTGLEAGANHFLLKPFAPDDLISTITTVLNG